MELGADDYVRKPFDNQVLMSKVRQLIKNCMELKKEFNVQEAAEAVGYNDIPTFRKHFVDFYGVTPSAFSKEDSTEKK